MFLSTPTTRYENILDLDMVDIKELGQETSGDAGGGVQGQDLDGFMCFGRTARVTDHHSIYVVQFLKI